MENTNNSHGKRAEKETKAYETPRKRTGRIASEAFISPTVAAEIGTTQLCTFSTNGGASYFVNDTNTCIHERTGKSNAETGQTKKPNRQVNTTAPLEAYQ